MPLIFLSPGSGSFAFLHSVEVIIVLVSKENIKSHATNNQPLKFLISSQVFSKGICCLIQWYEFIQ